MAYIGNSPDSLQRGRRFIYEFTASAGQTVFSGTDDNNQTLDLLEANEQSVFLNGVRLIPTDDYTVSGDVLTLTSAASLNDFLVVETQAEIVNISTYTRAESDARYVNYNGDIISGDLQVVGNISVSSGDISLGDNDKINIGASDDLQIYHDGSASYITDAGTGNLKIVSENFVVRTSDDTGNMIFADTDNAVFLYNAGNQKLATTTTGIDVTGVITSDGLTVNSGGDQEVYFGDATDGIALANTGAVSSVEFGNSQGVGGVGKFTYDRSTGKLVYAEGANGSETDYFSIASNGDISFYEDTGTTAKFFWDASAESLGIGTTTPTEALTVVNGTNTTVAQFGGTSGGADPRGLTISTFVSNGGNDCGVDFNAAINNDTYGSFKFSAGTNERMRIDSSGHLLVGKTTNGSSVTGCELREEGFVIASMDGDHAAVFDRKTSDGVIVQLRKDNTTVGSIFSSGGIQMGIGDGNTGLLFADNIDAVLPWSTTNTQRDAATDLGRVATRFKDLYLSGGVYVGGTGSANYLDDYEEGTWTPTFGSNAGGSNSGAVYSEQVGTYTKIGNRVICNFKITTTSKGTIGGSTARIFGWPFNSSATSITGKVAFENVGVSAVDWRPRGMYSSPLLTLDYKTSGSGNYVEAAATAFWTDTSSCWGYVSYFIS